MQSCSELNEFMPILTATSGLAYCVLKGQLSYHKRAAVCQDTGVLGGQDYRGYLGRATGRQAGQGYRGLALQGYRGQLGRATGGAAEQGYRGTSWAGLQGGQLDRATGGQLGRTTGGAS